jgi:uncharacterized 2Fe-2S/4Fe-4S cluster protein (DUF4445 family)
LLTERMMMKHNVTFLPDGCIFEADDGMTLLRAAVEAGLYIDAPCGGNGKCGKCRVSIQTDPAAGWHTVLACEYPITGNLSVDLSGKASGYRILEEGITREFRFDPLVKAYTVTVEKPVAGSAKPDYERLCQALSAEGVVCGEAEISVIRDMHTVLEENNRVVEAVLFGKRLIGLRAPGLPLLGLAVDIGTTTIVGYLLDLRTGEQLATASMLNPQSKFGADVIARANYAIENGVEKLSEVVRAALREIAEKAAADAGLSTADIFLVTVVGNTCMHHLFAGIHPSALVHAPYNPVICRPLSLGAYDLGLGTAEGSVVALLPNVAGFVGADTVGAVLASGMDTEDPLTLLIDIGTNGEVVLGNRAGMAACSTAAGPAFEGALIKCGMRGSEGAIDHITFTDTGLSYSVIGGGTPKGLCGSGVIDAIAGLLKVGLVDETGRLLDAEEAEEEAPAFVSRLCEKDGIGCFMITARETEGQVCVTQKDIREIQLAKGAMAAGIKMLAAKLGKRISDIERVYIAGAFGNYMSPVSACTISLIPQELSERIISIGNAAGQGAKIAALSAAEYTRAETIADCAGYLELAAHPDFQDIFVDELMF